MILLVLSIVGAVLFLYLKHQHNKLKPVFEKASNIPGPATCPLLGNALQFGRNNKDFFEYLLWVTREHGPIARVWIGPILAVILADAKYVEIIMGSNKHIDKSGLYKFGDDWLGQGLILSNGSRWKKHRKIITPAFHVKVLETFIDVFNRNTKILNQKLEKNVNGPDFDIFPYCNLAALDIICVNKMGSVMFVRAFNPLLHPKFIFNLSSLGKIQKKCLKVLHGMTNSVIRTRKKQKKQKYAFLDLLIQTQRDGEILSDEEVREEVDNLLLAGHDTTTSTLSFTCWLLAKHPDIQEKVMTEIEEIFGDSNRDPTFRDLQEMKYMEMVIKETLRLFPSVPIFGRILTEDVPMDEFILPAGTNIGFNPYMMHRDPKYFPDPEKFDPDRFLPENCVNRHPYCYIPFSAGPRICLGMKFGMMELKAMLTGILRKYKLLPPDPSHKLDLTMVLIIKSLTGIPVRLEYRT
ncbi:Cytochrome P450 4C1 [Blattella germanica]|nr:Cytochrome P450 4C1 [Blattella germanica]